MLSKNPQTVEEYIASYPGHIQILLQEVRRAIREAAPDAKETISYQIPAFEQNGILVWFAAFKNHISLFPKASGITAFEKKLTNYQIRKGTVQFPISEPLPLDLIKKIVRFRIKENSKANNNNLKAKKISVKRGKK